MSKLSTILFVVAHSNTEQTRECILQLFTNALCFLSGINEYLMSGHDAISD